MNPNNPHVSLLERAAEPLGEVLLEHRVYVGGAVAGVLITDPAMPEIRPTQDEDVICRVISGPTTTSWGANCGSGASRRTAGQGHPLPLERRRPRARSDVNPGRDPGLLQSLVSPRPGHRTASGAAEQPLDSDCHRTGVPGHQAGGLLRSWLRRLSLQPRSGGPDHRGRDGQASLLEDCRLNPPELRNDLAAPFLELLNTSAVLEALPAFLPPDQASQQRLPDLLETLRAIASLAKP